MIYDTLQNSGKYFHKDSSLSKAISFAIGFDHSKSDGRYEIEAEKIYALVSSYETSPASEKEFEVHRKYADVQVVIGGEEKIEISLSPELKSVSEYSDTKDKVLVEPPEYSASLVMSPGYFAVIYPNEAHRPNCNLREKTRVRKIVVKVQVH